MQTEFLLNTETRNFNYKIILKFYILHNLIVLKSYLKDNLYFYLIQKNKVGF